MSTGAVRITALAVGNFDGIHRGHMALFERLGRDGGVAVIEHYRATLTPGAWRARHVNLPLFFYDFGRLKDLSPEAFVKRLRADFPNLERIVVGEDFHFGAGRCGDTRTLRSLFEGEVTVVAEVKEGDEGIHSRVIREEIARGDVARAGGMLGRAYEVWGEVVRGQGLGAKALVPTLNLRTGRFLLPLAGVYKTRTAVEGRFWPSVTFVGHRVSTDGRFAVETHLIDRRIDRVRGPIGVRWLARLRENRRFETLAALKRQIEEDMAHARQG
ncbi:MAG: bifunctional riboflavin kinase/FAD synthetase [Epsilonproteobacteria bacterium]|nr:bifunctional riboflavin kinase/FAD synthetase [Campylobacterota bacterium]